MFDRPEDIDNVVAQSRYRDGYKEGLEAARREMLNILQMPGIIESRCLTEDEIQRVRDGLWGSLMIISCRHWHELQTELRELKKTAELAGE